jgi:uncharacterized membrane protein YkoI
MKPFNNFRVALAAVLLATVAIAGPGRADDGHDHDRARQALEAGEILPLKTILDRVEREYPGQVLGVELERQDTRWIYKIRVLRSGGTMLGLKLDGRDGTLLSSKERDANEYPGGHPHGGRP